MSTSLYKIEAELMMLATDFLDAQAERNSVTNEEESEIAKAKVESLSARIQDLLRREAAKVDSYAGLIRWAGSEAERYKAEEKRLAATRRGLESLVERLKSGALAIMKLTDAKRLEGAFSSLVRKTNGGKAALVIESVDLAPRYVEVTCKMTLDQLVLVRKACPEAEIIAFGSEPCNAAIRADLEAGKMIPGCRLERGEHVEVK